jgi:hypothetical protein
MTERTLILTNENALLWKIATVPHGSEGKRPHPDGDCPYFLETGSTNSCVSGSGGSMCGGFMGGTQGYVYCIWGMYE